MKILITLFFFCSFFCFRAFSQSDQCLEKIAIGKFEYYDASGKVIKVIRTKNKQIEILNNGNSKLLNKIKWISDTEYVTTFKKAINAPGCLKKGDKMKMTIIACEGDNYTVIANSENCGSAQVKVSIIKE